MPPSSLSVLVGTFLLAVITTLFCSGSGNSDGGRFYAQGFVVKAPTTTAFVSSSVRGGGVADGPSIGGGVIGTDSRSVLFSSTTTNDNDVDAVEKTTTTVVPSWENLESELKDIQAEEEPSPTPLLTLYRDTNGWCPFCERVWIAIIAKGIPYQETLVSLQNKPEWFKQMVPTGLVPAVLFHGDDITETTDDGKNNTSRTLVWESDAILYALDEMFPDTPRLMHDDNEDFKEAMDMQNRLQSAGFQYLYGGRNETTTESERQTLRANFEGVLDELDAALRDQYHASVAGDSDSGSGDSSDSVSGGCFRLGQEFSGVDAMMIPTLERWRYQLPINEQFDILENRSHLQQWFEHMDSFAPYADRVAGDEYSWTAVTSTFLRYFGGGEDKPEVAAKIQHADEVTTALTSNFIANYEDKKMYMIDDRFRGFTMEAVTKLITNHEAVVSDCVREEPLSQKHLVRASAAHRETADVLLRYVASVMLQASKPARLRAISAMNLAAVGLEISSTSRYPKLAAIMDNTIERTQGSLAVRTVATRLSVPRDMGAAAAAQLRAVLTVVADALEEDAAAEAGVAMAVEAGVAMAVEQLQR